MNPTKTYSLYIIRKKDPRSIDIYVGMTCNLKGRKSVHKSASKSKNPTGVDKFVKENGGWDNFVMYEFLTNIPDKETAKEEEEEYRRLYECTLNKNRSGGVSADMAEYQRNWLATNPEYKAEWKEKNPDYMKDWNKSNPTYHRDYQRRKAKIKRDEKLLLDEFLRLGSILI